MGNGQAIVNQIHQQVEVQRLMADVDANLAHMRATNERLDKENHRTWWQMLFGLKVK